MIDVLLVFCGVIGFITLFTRVGISNKHPRIKAIVGLLFMGIVFALTARLTIWVMFL
jgi:hypothetical protein